MVRSPSSRLGTPDLVQSYRQLVADDSTRRRSDAERSIRTILLAARDALAEDSSTELKLIAERAQVHRVTLYRHFPTREALITGLHNAWLDDAEAALLAVNPDADDLLSEIRALTYRAYRVHLEWKTYGWALSYASRKPERERRQQIGGLIVGLFTAAQQQGLLRRDLTVPGLLAAWGGPVLLLTGNIADGSWTLDAAVEHTMLVLTPPATTD